MPVRKRLLVLANSAKNDARCVAGREVIDAGGQYRLGGWVRPVSDHGGGELWSPEHAYRNGRSVGVLDIADVALDGPHPEPGQPENWSLAVPVGWADVTRRYRRPPPELLAETPPDLWLQPGERADRVTADHLLAHPPGPSLVVVRPADLRLAFWSEPGPPFARRRRRCRFHYNDVHYDLPLTDPVVSGRFEGHIPAPGRPPLEVPLAGDRLLVCVSLAGCFNGHHYKVVATVFEDRLWETTGGLFGSILSAIRTTLWTPSSPSSGPTT